uniref:Peptidase M41 domain-containing protein n=1 Tax=Ananas comosus var. bracteatus TaxID=296719 RepID=A0A6V7QLV2_ANACO|nr:unnamed protein product [Ananas comosus var. bracteatus]
MLWDAEKKEVVCNESYAIIEFLNSVPGGSGPDLCPPELKGEIEKWNRVIYPSVNNGVYRCGFAQSQEAYDTATFSSTIPKWLRRTPIAKKISKHIVNHLGLTLTREDMQQVVDLMEPYGQISNRIELLSPPLDWSMETKFPHAVWAAGRGLITLLLPNFDIVDNIWLEPTAWEGIGCTKITKAKNEGSVNGNVESRSYLETKLVFCFGSYIASQLLLPFGEENFLSSSELKQAQEIATRMVIQYGWGPDDSPAIYITSKAVGSLSMGNNHEFEMAAKVEKMYDLGYDKAREMLLKNRKVLEKIVEQLLEFENLTGEDLINILNENGGIREQEPFFLSKSYYSEGSLETCCSGGIFPLISSFEISWSCGN